MTRYQTAARKMLLATSAFVGAARELLAAARDDQRDGDDMELGFQTATLMRSMIQALLRDAPNYAAVFEPQPRK